MGKLEGFFNLRAPIAPFNEEDTYPVFDVKYGKGGHRTVETIEERDLIPEPRRDIGMLVYVKSTDKIYIYKEGNQWDELRTGAGSEGVTTTSKINIVGSRVFLYDNNYEKLLSSDVLVLDVNIVGIQPVTKIRWYVKYTDPLDSTVKWLELAGSSSTFIYANDTGMSMAHESLKGKKVWVDTKLTIKCVVNELYEDSEDVIKISNASGNYSVELMSSRGLIFKNGVKETTITALVFYQGEYVPDGIVRNRNGDIKYDFIYYWTKWTEDGELDQAWTSLINNKNSNNIVIKSDDVFRKATINCNIFKNEY